jgi:hypothetical protein
MKKIKQSIYFLFVVATSSLCLSAAHAQLQIGFKNGAILYFPEASELLAQDIIFTTKYGTETTPFRAYGKALSESVVLRILSDLQEPKEVKILTTFGVVLFHQKGIIRFLGTASDGGGLTEAIPHRTPPTQAATICHHAAAGSSAGIQMSSEFRHGPRNAEPSDIPERRSYDVDNGLSGYEDHH